MTKVAVCLKRPLKDRKMSLACLACYCVESPSQSFRSYSFSSSENESRCSSIANCLTRKVPLPPHPGPNSNALVSSSKVAPQPSVLPNNGPQDPPRLVRSRAVRRDLVQDWNFDELLLER